MNFEHIHFLLELAEHSSISSAAKKLHISQPSLTMVIKKAEEELNVKLFERTYSGIQLTEEGHQALPYLRRLHQTYHEMMEVLNSNEDKLVLGLSAGILYFVNPMIKHLKTMFRSFQIESFDFQPNLLETIQDRQFDLTVVTYEQYTQLDNKDFVFIPFMEGKIICIKPK
ncbi:LysR family transcriptional regulator [Bacillus sp. AGMB 02131]|uniref:LysR family transcriptional regulator n=1 Tax=Peribacillus faecalis TaxID=2772559 RepID=A0A927CXF2_9BACI|nr:LysR family transcriptional regulator [Peribacillus faecalis]MBD3108836.1 LysR family transcriptional regulator [Peribacillus faecalis]